MNIKKYIILLSVLLLLVTLPCLYLAEAAELVGDWYLAGITTEETFTTVEQLGTFMHIRLNEDGIAANVPQNGTETTGTWRMEDASVVVTFSDTDAIFSINDDTLATTLSDGSQMVFTRNVAGTYIPGNTIKAEAFADFNGTWNVQWIWYNGAYQSIEYLQYNFGMESVSVALEDGTLHTDDVDFGLTFSEGMLYFASEGEIQVIIALQDDGYLCYADISNGFAYVCTKAE